MSISYEISLTEEQFSDCTTVDSKEKDLLLSRKNSKFQNFFPISNNSFVIRAETKNYRTLYQEKCKSLENLEKEFNKLHESVSSLIENAKNVNNNYTSQISHLKDLVVFILDEYNNQNNQSIDYIINFIQNNNTIFQKNKEEKKNCQKIKYDDDFWEINNIHNNESQIYGKKIIFDKNKLTNINKQNVNFFMTKELEKFLYEKMKSFVLK